MLPPVDPLAVPDVMVVTGGGGWLGRALVRRLLDQNGPTVVLATVRDDAEADSLRRSVAVDDRLDDHRLDVRVADVTDATIWAGLLTRTVEHHGTVDLVHTVGVIHPRRVREFDAVNRGGTRHVIAAAQLAGVRRLVHVSSNSPFGTNPTPRDTFGEHEPYHPYLGYGRSKMVAEEIVLAAVDHGLDAVIVRPPWFYGPWQPPRQTTFFRLVRTGRFPVIGDGEQRRSMVYVDDLVEGVLAAARTSGIAGRGYWIADPEPYLVRDIVATVREALESCGFGCRDTTLRLPPLAGMVAERLDRMIQGVGRYQQQLHVLGEMRHSIAVDTSAARRDLGIGPGIGLAAGMRRSIEWCVEQGYEL